MERPVDAVADAEWKTRTDAETDWAYGERPEKRPIKDILNNGLVLLDKPYGPTSNQVSGWMRDVLARDKTGHAGTLDPHVTGVLPVGLNRGTRVLGYMSNTDKEYVCIMHTNDVVSLEDAQQTAAELVGTITQVPPEMSAVKKEARDREIYGIEVLEADGKHVLFRIATEKGFYVRTFCERFASELGTTGEMAELRRTKSGLYTEDDTVLLQDVVDHYTFWNDGEDHELRKYVRPIEAGVRHLRKVLIKDSAVAALAHGANLGTAGISQVQTGIVPGDTVALLTLKGELIAVASADMDTDTMLENDGNAATLDRVFMDPDLYPKEW